MFLFSPVTFILSKTFEKEQSKNKEEKILLSDEYTNSIEKNEEQNDEAQPKKRK
ncbi:14229_t:CDS:2 [Racocetra persica]|uniref:14229_t:CDS:1 n=1 Tax=Racocetra persica TaxID=160502 RepID=A0ACA9L3J9_9GLOM|nr:14229_t:CDS:2 [Racocetra persica]